jgi:hypothetical protein
MQKARSGEATREGPRRAAESRWLFDMRASLAASSLISLSQSEWQTQNRTDNHSAKKEYDQSAQTEKG